jgi:hypothetical protein
MTSHRDRKGVEVEVKGDFPKSRYKLELRSVTRGQGSGKDFRVGGNVGQGKCATRKREKELKA